MTHFPHLEFIQSMFQCCTHQERFLIKKPEFEQYMRQCSGWVEDPDKKYTSNYVVIVLLSEFKKKSQLIQDAHDNYFILLDRELQKIFKQNTPVISIARLRPLVDACFCFYIKHNHVDFRRYSHPLWCISPKMDRVLEEIFEDFKDKRSEIEANSVTLKIQEVSILGGARLYKPKERRSDVSTKKKRGFF